MKKSKYKNATGYLIRDVRKFRTPPMSQEQLAACVRRRGVVLDQTTISRIENRTRNVTDHELIAIARCLKVSVGSLCGERTRSTPPI